jgi:hypothetical protein
MRKRQTYLGYQLKGIIRPLEQGSVRKGAGNQILEQRVARQLPGRHGEKCVAGHLQGGVGCGIWGARCSGCSDYSVVRVHHDPQSLHVHPVGHLLELFG